MSWSTYVRTAALLGVLSCAEDPMLEPGDPTLATPRGGPDPGPPVPEARDPQPGPTQAPSFDRGDAVVARFGDRGRDRHAREDQFQSYGAR